MWDALDDVKGGSLPPELVHKARVCELQYLQNRQVYTYATVAEAIAKTGRPPLGLRWIDTNKASTDNPEVRSRLVCTEVRRKGVESIFRATPPLESLRALMRRLASEDPSGNGIGEYNDENVSSAAVGSVISSRTFRRMLLSPSCFLCLWFAIILFLCSLILLLF